MNILAELFNWIATQPAFIEVTVGVFFCLVIAPAALAGAATAITYLEGYIETGVSAIPMFKRTAPVFIRNGAVAQ